MAITTFSELITSPRARKVYLAEIVPGVELDSDNWTATGGGAYYQTWYERFFSVPVEIEKVEENGVELTKKSSIAEVEANAGSWYQEPPQETVWDNGATIWDNGQTSWDSWGAVYIHCTDSGSPNEKTVIAYIRLRFASSPVIFDNHYYFPRLSKEGLPSVSAESQDIFFSGISVGSAGISLLNNDGFFDSILRRYIWINREVKILLGGEELPYSEYKTIFRGKIQGVSYTDRKVSFSLRDIRVDFHKKLPPNEFYTTTYPHMDPGAEGKPIPIIWGEVRNIKPTLIDSTVNYGKYKVADHALYSVDAVYADGSALTENTDYSVDLANGEFTLLTSQSGKEITCDVKGRRDDASGSITGTPNGLIEKASDVVRDICINYLDVSSADIDSTSFEEARERDWPLSIYLSKTESSAEIIRKICQSTIAHFIIGADGKVYFKMWKGEVPAGTPTIKDEEIISFQASSRADEVFYKVIVYYGDDPENRRATSYSDSEVKIKYGRAIAKEVQSYLKDTVDANDLAFKLFQLAQKPLTEYEIITKLKPIELAIGDKIKIRRRRAPTATGKLSEDIFRILAISRDIAGMRTRLKVVEDIASLGYEVCSYQCQTGCEVSCQTACQLQPCQEGCEITCETTCEKSCQGGCLTSCQETCEVSCQTGCELGECETACELGECQTACESGECETACETGGCETACELQPCQRVCQISCQTACELQPCQEGCEVSCETGCEVSCTVGCEVSCQEFCEIECEFAEEMPE